MSDPFESKEVMYHLTNYLQTFRFTQHLRQKLREQRSSGQPQPTRATFQDDQRELGKRNAQIKKSYELEKRGLQVSPYLFEQEVKLLRHMKHSTDERYNRLYQQFAEMARRLDKPLQLSQDYILGRVYKFLLFRYEYEPVSDKYEKDYFNFNSMYLQRLDAKKQEDLKSIVHQIHQHRDNIM